MEAFQFNYRNTGPIRAVFHSHPFFEVYYFHGGKCNYLIGNRIYVLAPGDLLLMNGMTLHCAKIDPSVEYIRSIVHFDPAILQPYLELTPIPHLLQPFYGLGNYRIRLAGAEREEAEGLLSRMDAHYRRGDEVGGSRCRLAFLDLLHLVFEWCRAPLAERSELPSEKEQTVQRIVSYIENHFNEEIRLGQLQDHLHLSKFYLSKLFKEVTGVTIFDFLYQHRINQAKTLFLLDGKLSVTEAGFRVGFKHLAHFSRIFKQRVGVTPEQYRKSAGAP